jgi:hypothetical protein
MSAIAVSSGYLRKQPLFYLGNSSCSNYGRDFSDNCIAFSILDSWGFWSIVGSDSIDSSYK